MSFLEIFPRNVFCALPLPCLRGLKSLNSATTAALYLLPAMTNPSLVRKWFLVRFFGDLHRQFLITSPCRAPPPTPTPKNCKGWLVHAPGAPTNKISSGDEIATPLASFHLGSITTGFPPLRKVNNPPQQCPPAAHLLPRAPLVMSQVQNVTPPFQHREPANFQKQ